MAEPTVKPDWHASVPVTEEMLTPAAGPYEEVPWVEGDHPTDNPDGVTVSNVDYWPKTQEEKAEALLVDMVRPVHLDHDERCPYPTGNPPGHAEREAMLKRIHTPSELVPGPDRAAAQERALRAGGAEVTSGAA